MMDELLIVLVVVLVLVALNGLFVAAEFAIIGASRAAMTARAEAGDAVARRIVYILDDPARLDRYVATAQLGITFASLGLGMYGEHTLAVMFSEWLLLAGFAGLGALVTAHGLASVLAILAITYLHIVLGEMIPKSLALTRSIKVAIWVTPPMLLIGMILYPLVRVLNLTGNLLLGLVGFKRGRSAGHYLAQDELESLARESQESGLLSEESGRIFLELADFSEIAAVEAMVPRVRASGIPVGATDAMLREILHRHRHTRCETAGRWHGRRGCARRRRGGRRRRFGQNLRLRLAHDHGPDYPDLHHRRWRRLGKARGELYVRPRLYPGRQGR
jgi:CBS domain containing-hemolysin-like protein